MQRTVALLGVCTLCVALLACGGDAIDAEAPSILQPAEPMDAPGPGAATLIGRANASDDAQRNATETERPRATADAHGRITIPNGALWGSVRDSLREAAAKRRSDEGLPTGTPVQISLPGDGSIVVVDGVRNAGVTGLALRLKAGPPPSMEVAARGTAWIARLGCESATTWRAESWSLALWQNTLAALSMLEDDGKRSIQVEADAAVPAEEVLRFLAALGATRLGPALVETRRWRRVEDAVTGTGNWLARHQASTGAWDEAVSLGLCDGRLIRDVPLRGDPEQAENAGLTGLCLCAFLGAGYTNRGKHPYKTVVSSGLRHLKRLQQPDGTFPAAEGWDPGVAHAIASLAMLEAYGMTGSPIFKGSAQRALGALKATYLQSREDALPIVLTAMALKSARLINADALRRGKPARLVVDDTLKDLLLRHIQGLHADTGDVQAACWLLTRLLLEDDAYKAADVKAGALILAKALHDRTDACDPAALWLATLACYRVSREPWKIMKRAIEKHAVDTQRKDGHPCCFKGSWDPLEASTLPAGRVAATALHALCLEIYYRYDRVFGIR